MEIIAPAVAWPPDWYNRFRYVPFVCTPLRPIEHKRL
jgi:hypothetical protein